MLSLRKTLKVDMRLHELRTFLRSAIAMSECSRRPKDFAGLERGLSENFQARECMYAAQLHFGGPALASAGLWTSLNISKIPLHNHDSVCVRCGNDDESTFHRLWLCPHNAHERSKLDLAVPGNSFPDGLPPCLARCGLIPEDFASKWHLSCEHAISVVNYLLAVNAIATLALADGRLGKEIRLHIDQPRALPVSAIYSAALPPLKRMKPGVETGVPRVSRYISAHLPPQPSLSEFCPLEQLVISCDGSYRLQSGCSGWGFTIASTLWRCLRDFCGPTVLVPNDPCFLGASRHSNNVGEVTSIFLALCWLFNFEKAPPASFSRLIPVVIEFDSQYAFDVISRRSRVSVNIALVLNARHIYDKVRHLVSWRKVSSHTNLYLNDRADHLAKCGAEGIYAGYSSVMEWAAGISSS